jgi:hypothetical protein
VNTIRLSLALVIVLVGCKSFPSGPKELEAESRYGAEQYHECVAPEPILGPRASREERSAAWERVDKCRAGIQARWTIGDGGVK